MAGVAAGLVEGAHLSSDSGVNVDEEGSGISDDDRRLVVGGGRGGDRRQEAGREDDGLKGTGGETTTTVQAVLDGDDSSAGRLPGVREEVDAGTRAGDVVRREAGGAEGPLARDRVCSLRVTPRS